VIEPSRFREVMASFPSGVVVLTAFGEDGQPRGLTVSAFCAVSLQPALALACIDKLSNTLPAVQHTGGFTANILAAGRESLARRMATKDAGKFGGIAWRRPEGGAGGAGGPGGPGGPEGAGGAGGPGGAGSAGGPILEQDVAAYAVCTLRETIEGGDHWILLGLVTEGAVRDDVAPMVFSRRGYFDL
jgi:flavin reductase (DIM6/NTAB) family NADH-FMN oxidoreductase RutF